MALLMGCGKKEQGPSTTGLGGRDSVVLGSPATTALSSQGVVFPVRRTLAETLEVSVRIEVDERRNIQVVAPAAGRLEEIFVRTPDQSVKAGERLALLYSPELVTAQREFLLLDPDKDAGLIRQAEERLDRMGFSAALRRSLRASRKPLERIPILSPKAGYVLAAPMPANGAMDGNAMPAAEGMSGSMGRGMSGGGMGGADGGGDQGDGTATAGNPGSALRAGAYVTRGTVLAQINDLATVSAVLSLPVRAATLFREGDSVHLDLGALGYAGMASLDFLESRVADTGGNVRARAYLRNPDMRFKLGALGKGHLVPEAESTWVLPRSAVHDLGERHMAWVRSTRDTGAFLAREIRIGRAGTRWVEVLEGVPPGAAVAENASLLLDPDVVLELWPLGGQEPEVPEEDHGGHGQHATPAEAPGHGEHSSKPEQGPKQSSHSHTGAAASLSLPEEQIRLAGIRSDKVGYSHLAPTQEFRAMTRFDSRSQDEVPARVEGRIVSVPALRPGERVQRGQTLATIESEPLLSAQEEYLVAVRSAAKHANPELIRSQVQAARRRLLVFGMTEAQVTALEKRGRTFSNLPIASPRDGILLDVRVQPGQYVAAGAPLFTVGVSNRIWVETWLLAQEAADYPEGTEALVRVEGISGEPMEGRLEHVRQETALSGSVTLAHIGITNPDARILPGMQAWVTFRQAGKHALSIPTSALLRSSTSTMVWVEVDKHTYAPRMVRTGLETADSVEILSGVAEGEAVVVAGAYLLNSEWILRQGAGKVHASH